MPDDEQPGKRHYRKIDWLEVRAAFEAGENISAIAKRTGISRRLISQHRDLEKWSGNEHTVQKAVLTGEARSNVVDIVTRKAVDRLGGEAGIEAAAVELATDLAATLKLASKAVRISDALMDEFLAGDMRCGSRDEQSKADLADKVLSVSVRAAGLVREMHGIRPGQPSAIDGKAGATRRFVLTTPEEVRKAEAG